MFLLYQKGLGYQAKASRVTADRKADATATWVVYPTCCFSALKRFGRDISDDSEGGGGGDTKGQVKGSNRTGNVKKNNIHLRHDLSHLVCFSILPLSASSPSFLHTFTFISPISRTHVSPRLFFHHPSLPPSLPPSLQLFQQPELLPSRRL